MKIAIIGASGFIGRHLTSWCRERGDIVTEVRSSHGGIDPESGLFAPSFQLEAGTEAVVYLSQSPHYRAGLGRIEHLLSVNVTSAARAAQLALAVGAKKFLYASTGNVYAPSFGPLRETDPLLPAGPYPTSKRLGEEAVRCFLPQLDVSVARIFGAFGEGQRGMLVPNLYAALKKGGTATLDTNPENSADAEGLRISLCYIRDCVAALRGLLDVDGAGIVNVGGIEPVSIHSLATAIGESLGVKVPITLGDRKRTGNLIASVDRLRDLVPLSFTPSSQALQATFQSFQQEGL